MIRNMIWRMMCTFYSVHQLHGPTSKPLHFGYTWEIENTIFSMENDNEKDDFERMLKCAWTQVFN